MVLSCVLLALIGTGVFSVVSGRAHDYTPMRIGGAVAAFGGAALLVCR